MTRSLLPDTVKFFFASRLPYNAKLKLSIRKGYIPVGSVNNMNKLSLVGMQLLYLKNIRRISTFRLKTIWVGTPDERPSLETSKFFFYFSGTIASLPRKACSLYIESRT